MRNMTTAMLVLSDHIPDTGLHQSMLNTQAVLDDAELLCSPILDVDRDQFAAPLSKHHIHCALRSVFKHAFTRLLRDNRVQALDRWPEIQRLDSKKTESYPLGIILQEEGSIQGTYAVHKEIFLKKLQIPKDDPQWSSRLWLAYGDQLTAIRNRSVKGECVEASEPFERRQWLVSPSAPFHTAMNFASLVNRGFQSVDRSHGGKRNVHTLTHDADFWVLKKYKEKSTPYYALRELVV